jgi:hypothetical protein
VPADDNDGLLLKIEGTPIAGATARVTNQTTELKRAGSVVVSPTLWRRAAAAACAPTAP